MRTDVLTPLSGLEQHLEHWVSTGVVTPVQADAIRTEERMLLPATPRRTPLVTEALGYLGGVLVLVASLLLVGQLWDDLSTGTRVGVVAGAAALLGAAGVAVPSSPGTAGERLRSVLWVLSTAAAAFAVGLLGREVLDVRGPDLAVLVTVASTVLAASYWRFDRVLLQQAAVVVALVSTSVALLSELPVHGEASNGLPGIGPALVGGAWVALAGLGPLVPKVASRRLGAVAVVLGTMWMQASVWGRPLALVLVAGVVGLGLLVGDLGVLAIGTLGVLAVVPAVVTQWFPGAVAAPIALLVCGVLLVLVALRALRSRA